MPSLVVLVTHDLSHVPELLSAWYNAGVPGVTVIDSIGASAGEGRAWCDDLPMFPSLRDLLRSGETPRKTLFSVLPDDLVEPTIRLTTEIMGDFSEPERKGILFVLPIARVIGLPTNEPNEKPTAST